MERLLRNELLKSMSNSEIESELKQRGKDWDDYNPNQILYALLKSMGDDGEIDQFEFGDIMSDTVPDDFYGLREDDDFKSMIGDVVDFESDDEEVTSDTPTAATSTTKKKKRSSATSDTTEKSSDKQLKKMKKVKKVATESSPSLESPTPIHTPKSPMDETLLQAVTKSPVEGKHVSTPSGSVPFPKSDDKGEKLAPHLSKFDTPKSNEDTAADEGASKETTPRSKKVRLSKVADAKDISADYDEAMQTQGQGNSLYRLLNAEDTKLSGKCRDKVTHSLLGSNQKGVNVFNSKALDTDPKNYKRLAVEVGHAFFYDGFLTLAEAKEAINHLSDLAVKHWEYFEKGCKLRLEAAESKGKKVDGKAFEDAASE